MEIHKVKGFADIIYPESALYSYIESIGRTIFSRYMYKELRTPLVEFTELFTRGIGSSTDVVQKEMYTFLDKKGRSITLRPEATAGVVRAYIENSMETMSKFFTFGAMFRYERPQKGRMRQFHQINCECFGSESPLTDVETISMLTSFLKALGIENTSLHLNSLGCSACRPEYKRVLREYLESIREELCITCQNRMEHNPLRVLDCKEERCISYTKDAPLLREYICKDCGTHFTEVREMLDALEIEYVLQPRLVRGLDYYTRTTFEVVSNAIGAQSSIAGGGRYDGLVEQMGGKNIPAIGFACGMERLVLLLRNKEEEKIPYYIVPLCIEAQRVALILAERLRSYGIDVEVNVTKSSVKQAMKYAGKYTNNCILIGEEEIAKGTYSMKNMATGIQQQYTLNELIELCTKV